MQKQGTWGGALALLCCAAAGAHNVQHLSQVPIGILQRWTDKHAVHTIPHQSPAHMGAFLLDIGWQSVALSSLLAVQHFNNRDGRFVPAFSSPEMRACDKNWTLTGLVDTQSSSLVATRHIVRWFDEHASHPHVIVGPARSSEAGAVATVASAQNVPVISYWATAPELSSSPRFPNFMRTIPCDRGSAFAVCSFWATEMHFSAGAVVYAHDAYGDGFKSVLRHLCVEKFGMRIQTFEVDGFTEDAVASPIAALVAVGMNVVHVIATGLEVVCVIEAAVAQGALRRHPTSLWTLTDGISASDLGLLSIAAKDAIDGSVRIAAQGANDENPLWQRFVQEWSTFTPPPYSDRLPANWSTSESVFSDFDINASSIGRDIATFMYDAVAAAGFLACRAAPQGPLPTTFGANFYEARRNWSFDGLTGSVSFDENGDRVVASGTWSLSNVLLDAATNEFELVLKAVFDGGRWVWRAGKRDLVYNYRSTDEPVDQLQPPSPPPSPPPPPPAGDKFLLLLIVAAVAAAILFCKTHSPPRAKQRLKGRISENFFLFFFKFECFFAALLCALAS
uniref:Receptor ligand binding region domain-containing protein n=1 Tax=Chrysotila carterae TaxID=13221 RepID=A0A7S4F0B8_CHRCT